MNRYLSTFISGLAEPIRAALIGACPDADIELLLDGLIVYRSASDGQKIRNLRFFNNSFEVFQIFENLGANPMGAMIEQTLHNKQLDPWLHRTLKGRGRTFRIVTSREGRTVSVDRKLIGRLEVRIGRATGLRTDRSRPEVELWYILRRDQRGFFCLRLTRHTAWEKVLQRGQLRPQLAHLLCLISEPRGDDAFLDPFAGSGAIALERARAFPFRQIFAGDIDNEKVKLIRAKNRKLKHRILVRQLDATNLGRFRPGTFTRIVTDPPWGHFESPGADLGTFYRKMLEQFRRLLAPEGILVVLVAEKELFESVLEEMPGGPKAVEKYDILVSGKKSAVYKITNQS